MKKITILIAIMILVSGCELVDNFMKKEQKAPARMQMPPAKVTILKAEQANLPISFSYPAKLTSDLDIDVRAKISGTLEEIKFKPGQKVKKDDVLFIIDPEKYQATYNLSKANVEVANANLKQAQRDFKRVKQLYEKNSISQKEYDGALAAYEISKANLLSAKAASKNSKIDLSYTKIKAPFSGIIGDSNIKLGDFIAPNTPLVRLTNLDEIQAEFYISDVDNLNRQNNISNNQWEQINKKATITLNHEIYDGKLSFIDSSINANTGSIKAKAVFENKNAKLLPGSFATVSVSGFVQKQAFKIPQIAILQDVISPYVLVLKDNKVVKKNIKIAFQNQEYAIINDGINDGDLIITDNFKKIRPGAPVVADGEFNNVF